jgi:hypothetical protein
MRALGAGPAITGTEGLIGVLAAVTLGSLLAVAVAICLSQLAPLGPVRRVYPDGGISFDWTVLGHARRRPRVRATDPPRDRRDRKAALPGRRTARTPTVLVLRAE